MRLCFSYDDVGTVHLAKLRDSVTLCGKTAFAGSVTRRLVTCEDCKKAKPKILGGGNG